MIRCVLVVGGGQPLHEDGLRLHQDARALCRGHHQYDHDHDHDIVTQMFLMFMMNYMMNTVAAYRMH